MAKKKGYTKDEYRRFKKLVEMGESRVQMDRINSRLQMPAFIEEVGRAKCNVRHAWAKADFDGYGSRVG